MTSSVSDFGRDHGLIHEAVVTGRKAGWTVEEWSQLAHSEERMREIRQYLRGHASIVAVEHIIDLNAQPLVPDSWSVEKHQKGGELTWDAVKASLYLSKEQQNGKHIEGYQLRQELKKKPVYNANLLDYLLAHQHLIPDEWIGKAVFFWGTIYRVLGGNLCVRCFDWSGDGCNWSRRWLDRDWSNGHPAAVFSS